MYYDHVLGVFPSVHITRHGSRRPPLLTSSTRKRDVNTQAHDATTLETVPQWIGVARGATGRVHFSVSRQVLSPCPHPTVWYGRISIQLLVSSRVPCV